MIQSILSTIKNITVEELITNIDHLINLGYSAAQILEQFFKVILEEEKMDAISKSRIMEKIADVDACLIQGSRDDIQLYDLFVSTKEILSG